MIKSIAKIRTGQDGAIYNDLLFRLSHRGECLVYDLNGISCSDADTPELTPIASFVLDKANEFLPHSNSVIFGNEFYSENDEFPLLYTNIYNNYAKAENKYCGVCCVYRIERCENGFCSTLVQIIEIGFTDDRNYWRSSDGANDIRPYGNFVIDTKKDRLYAFVMRDSENNTRYFSFSLPKALEGSECELGVKKVVLNIDDIQEYFDTPYHHYLQGAVCHNGKIYSVEGFNEKIHPALRIIDTELKKQTFFFDFYDAGLVHEAEFIDFHNEKCYYSDAKGNLFELEF